MKDGVYELSLSAYAYSQTGQLTLTGDEGSAEDGNFRISVQLLDAAHDLRGIVRFVRLATASTDAGLPAAFSLNMIGSGGNDRFNLIGTGPLGIIVEIDAARIADATYSIS